VAEEHVEIVGSKGEALRVELAAEVEHGLEDGDWLWSVSGVVMLVDDTELAVSLEGNSGTEHVARAQAELAAGRMVDYICKWVAVQ
jgi:hypothetical protein